MNFFEHQQQARVASKRLVFLFVLAVIGVVAAINLLVGWGLAVAGQKPTPGLHALITLAVLALIGGGTAWETMRLRSGGEAVAAMVGARAVDPGTRDLLERRLINVVEEMSLASGTPVPRVYIMDEEAGINAFAAGHSVNDAVIAVTRGTLTRLSRDELQGVVAHEFSHILNGDMRLNIRLISVLFGLMMLAMAGRFMMEVARGGRDSKGAGAVVMLGIALWIIGYIGVFFGRLIKAGVSRSREYLADASAVQFTRNPDGIGGALRKISWLSATPEFLPVGGTAIQHPHAETLSHLFLGAARSNFASGMMATHPPLDDRIERIYGRKMHPLRAPDDPVAMALAGEAAAAPAAAASGSERKVTAAEFFASVGGETAHGVVLSPLASIGAAAAPGRINDSIGTSAPRAQAYVASWADRVREAGLGPALEDSVRAQLLVLALLVDKGSDVAAQQRQAIVDALGAQAAVEVDVLHAKAQALPPGGRLPLLDLAMPALRKLPPSGGDRLLMLAHTLILADGRMTLAEFLLFTVLKRRIGTDAQRAVPLRYRAVTELPEDAARVLSLLAHVRDPQTPSRVFALAVPELPAVTLTLMGREEMALDRIAAALDRLNQLVPLAKPGFIKACAAVALADGGAPHWKAASCLRTICAALDSPLPPALQAAEGG